MFFAFTQTNHADVNYTNLCPLLFMELGLINSIFMSNMIGSVLANKLVQEIALINRCKKFTILPGYQFVILV